MKMFPSPNFDARPESGVIDMLVFHYTGMSSAAAALNRLCDPASKVSAHYLIEESGRIVPLVAEQHRAWHAGVAHWRGREDVNARSIGIELVNPGHEFGYRDFPRAQMAALEDLALDILSRHPIPARNVVGHSDVAPRRKRDPGERFDWRGLAEKGVGLWPENFQPEEVDGKEAARMLAQFGYETEDLAAAATAFHRHFRPSRIEGPMDGETTGMLRTLLALCK